jgi:hypothetical protein
MRMAVMAAGAVRHQDARRVGRSGLSTGVASCSSSFDLALEPLEHAWPAPIDRVAHGLTRLCAHLFEFAVFQLDAR